MSKFTIARLFNTGNYEHMRVEIEVTVPEGASAAESFIGAERVLVALKPKCPVDISDMHEHQRRARWEDADWKRSWLCQNKTVEEAKAENAKELSELEGKYAAWKAYQEKTRKLLDDLGAACHYKDAKLDWDQDEDW